MLAFYEKSSPFQKKQAQKKPSEFYFRRPVKVVRLKRKKRAKFNAHTFLPNYTKKSSKKWQKCKPPFLYTTNFLWVTLLTFILLLKQKNVWNLMLTRFSRIISKKLAKNGKNVNYFFVNNIFFVDSSVCFRHMKNITYCFLILFSPNYTGKANIK